jgi:filamentous hemagglutinin family protein
MKFALKTLFLTFLFFPFATIAIAQVKPALVDETSASLLAQVTPDGTTSTTVNSTATGVQIDNGDRAGGNLFHSFGDFSVPAGSEAYFNNANDIVNIFSRVTGGNISNIDGILRANGTANLFLINPAGILFGENASLQLGGSFYGSTADSIVFSDGEFSATDLENPPLITINAPIGLNFRDEPQPIINRSFVQNVVGGFVGLEVVPGATLTLVGGDIDFQGGEVTASGGRIELGGLAEAGIVTINEDGSLSFPENLAKANLTFSNVADLDVRGTGGGSVTLNGNNLSFEGTSTIKAGIIADSTVTEAQAGDINLNATGTVSLGGVSGIENRVYENATGNSGEINITAESLSISEGSYLSSSLLTSSQGTGGDININTTGAVTLDGVSENRDISRIASVISEGAEGDGGDININAGSLSLTNGALLNTLIFSAVEELPGGIGNAGDIKISTEGTVTISGFNEASSQNSSIVTSLNSGAVGNAGNIEIKAQNLNITDGGTVDASTFGQGNAGKIIINTSETISVTGENFQGLGSGVYSNVNADAVGNAGGIEITTANLTLSNGAVINGSTFGQGDAGKVTINASDTISATGEDSEGFVSGIFSNVNADAVGNAKGIEITTANLTLSNGGKVSASTFSQGNAGKVTVNASDTVSATGEDSQGFLSGVFSTVGADAVGNAEGIEITTANLTLKNGAVINGSTLGQGDSGTVIVNASETILATGEDSEGLGGGIFNRVETDAVGNGGGIEITTANLTLSNGGRVTASTFGQGNAGKVTINASETISATGEDLEGSGSGIVSAVATDAVGNGGGIEITTANLTLSDGGTVSASTFGQGNAGKVTVNASDTISVTGENSQGIGTGILNTVEANAVGNAGGIDITTGNLSLSNGTTIDSSTLGQGDAGKITINASDTISVTGEDAQGFVSGIFSTVDNTFSTVDTNAESQAGGIEITTANLTLSNGGTVSASTFGQGDAGTITINARNTISVSGENSQGIGSGIFSTLNSGKGNAGEIEITTATLTLSDGGKVNASTFGQGNAGKVTVNASDTILATGEDSQNFVSGIFSGVDTNAVGNAGGIEITTANLTLSHGGRINASTFGPGNAGKVTINASDTILATGENLLGFGSGVFSNVVTDAVGNAGGIEITTANLTLSNSGNVNASTFG